MAEESLIGQTQFGTFILQRHEVSKANGVETSHAADTDEALDGQELRADGRGAAADRGPDGQGANASSDAIQVSCNAIVDPDGQHGRAGKLFDAIH